ncbi:MAG: TonB-dependent receptor, partial [Bacteroidota bacterium]|nr:TonB-dependent receptor [Bacteroidota bacterium]
GYVSKSSGDYDSRYVLDYLQHKVVLSCFFPVSDNLAISILANYQDRAGYYTDWDKDGLAYQHAFDPYYLIDIKAEYKLNFGAIFVNANNLLNEDYADIGQVWQPGRWISFGCNFSLSR